jgi:hypothetical protein
MSAKSNVIDFIAATVYGRKIDLLPKLVMLTGGHKGQSAKVDLGYILIEKEWHPKLPN